MEESIIPRIQSAINADKTTLQQLNIERNEVLQALYKARFVDACDIHKIEAKYIEKINSKIQEVEMMEKHIEELTDDAYAGT